ncbi:MAG TPA: peptidylprolyl isomerase [Terriglobia bacterium]|jgi:peptidyl-prolyl cis-trans isomerase A (cyclophilin A)|nr:peptidylprolyl isomerase [Terriglobia bacterium]
MRKLPASALGLAVLICLSAAGASGQTSPPAQSKTATTKKSTSTTHHTAVHRSLLDPSTLNQKAPDTFKAKFTTTKGDFVIEVTRASAPLGADRFYNLVKNGFFTNVIFFRAVPDFVVQFGISGDPKIAAAWSRATISDDPVVGSNKRGTVTFATAGPNTRTTQIFINLNDRNTGLDGQGFAPFGQVVDGMDVVEKFYNGYGEQVTSTQDQIEQHGNAFLQKNFPNLDSIKTAVIVLPPAPAKTGTATKKPAAAGSTAAPKQTP